MKKLVFTFLVMLMGLTAMAQTATHVRVATKSGETALIAFTDQPEITFLADGIKVSSNADDPVTFEFDDVTSIDFVSSTEVAAVGENAVSMAAYPDRVVFLNVPEGSQIKVFSLDGRALRNFKADGEATLYKSEFGHGVYVVVVGNTSFKLSF